MLHTSDGQKRISLRSSSITIDGSTQKIVNKISKKKLLITYISILCIKRCKIRRQHFSAFDVHETRK